MKGKNFCCRMFGVFLFILVIALDAANAAEWPAYRRDVARSAVTPERLQFPLGTAWSRRLPQAPQPAWPDDGRSFPVFEFDLAPVPVSAGGMVYLANSADDTVYALDGRDGSVRWTYTAGAPVRFAPHIAHGRCYFSSDDGMVYSLDAASGEVVWSRRIALSNRMMIGNNRLISRWPSRSGVLVKEDSVYVVAGMWPSEGVDVYRLDAHTGETIWINDTSNAYYIPYPHDGLSLGGPTSQGYLATDGKRLVMPTGESAPAQYDMESGRFIHWEARAAGSSWATIIDNFIVTAARGWQQNIPVVLGETEQFAGDGLSFTNMEGRGYGKWGGYDRLPGSPRDGVTRRWRGQITPIGGRNRAVYSGDRFYASGMGELEALDVSGQELKRLWKIDHERIFCLALAGDVLIAGSEGFVFAVNASSGEVVWRGQVDGQARGLAVAGGTLYVTTEQGGIFAFAPGYDAAEARRRTSILPYETEGYALVIGNADIEVARRLGDARRLSVVLLMRGETEVQQARNMLVRQGRYGRHIVVHELPEDGLLPYGDFFATEILVVGDSAGIDPAEIYRVLRPITGRIWFANMSAQSIEAFARQAGIPEAELDGRVVTRGKLEGAFDWDSPGRVDERVTWPLEILWFGGPGRQRTLSRHRRDLPAPVSASGRIFSLGDGYVTAVDAYNGRELWSYHTSRYGNVAADDEYAYITVGGLIMQLDAQTGELKRMYGNPEWQVHAADGSKVFSAESENGAYAGYINVGRSNEALEIYLRARNPVADHRDAWILWFDFREEKERLLPKGRGRFPLIIDLQRGQFRRFKGFTETSIPKAEIERKADGLILRIPFEEIRELTGSYPATFDMSAQIDLWAQDFPSYPRRELSGAPLTGRSDPWRNGTATFVLRGEARPSLSPMAAVDLAPRNEAPAISRQWGRVPLSSNQRQDALYADEWSDLAERVNPITGITGKLFFLRGYGCSPVVASATMNFFRSGTVGLYDLADDSGMRNLPGTRPGCRITLSPSQGLMISLEGVGDCFCPYNFATSVAMAPARERSNEDWAVFVDSDDVGRMRQIGLNFGAPGDRRDEQGLLWLGYPRERMMYATGGSFGSLPQTISLPIALDMAAEGGPYRVNANRVVVENTPLPWVAASGVEGIRRINLGVTYYEPLTTAYAAAVKVPPRIDGILDDDAWRGDPGVPLTDDPGGLKDDGRVQVRYDDEHLYLSFAKKAVVDRRGVAQPWDGSTAFNFFIKDADHSVYAQFKADLNNSRNSRSVGRTLALPFIDGALPPDWHRNAAAISLGENHGAMQLAWTPRGLALRLQVPVERNQDFGSGLRVQFANVTAERILELVVDTGKGTAGLLRGKVVDRDGREIDPPAPGTARPRRNVNQLRDYERLETDIAVNRTGRHLQVDALIPVGMLELQELHRPSIAFQISSFDPGSDDVNITSGAAARRNLLDGGNLLTLWSTDGIGERRRIETADITGEHFGMLWHFAVSQREIAADRWRSAAHADDEQLSIELAIPRRLLQKEGLDISRMLAQFGAEGNLTADIDQLSRRFNSRNVRIHKDATPEEPTSYTLRLHFAEVDDIEPGQRVFDVKIQGRTAIEGLDIVRDAGGPRRALTHDFRISTDRDLTVDFVPRVGEPRISGLELLSR